MGLEVLGPVLNLLSHSQPGRGLVLRETYYSVIFARSRRWLTWLIVCWRRLGIDSELRASSFSASNSWFGTRSLRVGAGEAEPIDGAGSTPKILGWLEKIFSYLPRWERKAHPGRREGGNPLESNGIIELNGE